MSSIATGEAAGRTPGPEQVDARSLSLGPYVRWLLVLASTGAAAIHFAFTPAHFEEYWRYGLVFVTLGWLQLAWAFTLLLRPSRIVLYLGLLNALVVAAWLASRTIGVGFGPLASSSEPIGFPDTLSAALEVVVVLGSAALLWKPELVRRPLTSRSVWPGLTAALTVALVVTLSASLTPSLAGHAHDEGGAHEAGAHDAGGHDASHATVVPTGRKVEPGPLIAATRRNLVRWENVQQAEADGFRYIGDGPFQHYVNWAWVSGPGTLNPEKPESLVYIERADGTKQLVSAMYIARWGTAFDKVPNVVDKPWHSHPDLCWDEDMVEVGSTFGTATGKCSAGKLVALPPMLHVWFVDNACGPFAELENSGDVGARILQGQDPDANGKPQTGGCNRLPNHLRPPGQASGAATDDNE